MGIMIASPQFIDGVLRLDICDAYEPYCVLLVGDDGTEADLTTWIESLRCDGQKVRVTIETIEE